MTHRRRRSSRRLRKRSAIGHRVRRVRRKDRTLMSTASGPWIIIGLAALFVAALVLLVVFLVVPIFDSAGSKPAPTPRLMEASPTPVPHAVQTAELGALQKEITPGVRYVADPWYYDGTLVFSGGVDENGNSKMHTIFSCGADGTPKALEIELLHDDFASLKMNDRWLVFTDGMRAGSGSIRAMDRASGNVVLVKDYFAGQPTLALDGDTLVWTERTGTYMDKLYACDLVTMEQVTVATFENNRYGISDPGAAKGQIIWAEEDSTRSPGEEAKSIIKSLDLKTGISETYQAGMYVHDPVTNGEQWAWLDSDHGAGAKLYLRDDGEPVLIADDVTTYGMTDKFLAYNQNNEIYVYFFSDKYEQIITPASEQAILAAVSDGSVIWYQTGISNRDVLKYAVID